MRSPSQGSRIRRSTAQAIALLRVADPVSWSARGDDPPAGVEHDQPLHDRLQRPLQLHLSMVAWFPTRWPR